MEEEKNNHKLPAIYTKSKKKKRRICFVSVIKIIFQFSKKMMGTFVASYLSPAGFLVYLSIVWMSPFLLSL
jgi:hypothetical protein